MTHHHPLSPMERDVLSFLAAGYRYNEIAEIKSLSFKTIKHQAYNAQWKLGARTMFQAVALYAVMKEEAA